MLLFLDFDGVLHPVSGHKPFKTSCMNALSTTLKPHPELKIVITSSWREIKTSEELEAYLGPDLGKRIIGATPIIDDPFLHHVRFHEVTAYLEGNGMMESPWVAIDDEPGNYPDNAPVILTDRRLGFTDDDSLKLKEMIQQNL